MDQGHRSEDPTTEPGHLSRPVPGSQSRAPSLLLNSSPTLCRPQSWTLTYPVLLPWFLHDFHKIDVLYP